MCVCVSVRVCVCACVSPVKIRFHLIKMVTQGEHYRLIIIQAMVILNT